MDGHTNNIRVAIEAAKRSAARMLVGYSVINGKSMGSRSTLTRLSTAHCGQCHIHHRCMQKALQNVGGCMCIFSGCLLNACTKPYKGLSKASEQCFAGLLKALLMNLKGILHCPPLPCVKAQLLVRRLL